VLQIRVKKSMGISKTVNYSKLFKLKES